MRTPPADLRPDALADHLRRHWSLDVDDLTYAPVGFGSHHWWLTTVDGSRHFVTVDEVADDTALLAAMTTATALREAGLEFVVAPTAGTDGAVVHRLAERWSVAVFRAVEGRPWPAGAEQTPDDRRAVLDLLARLHLATEPARATVRRDDLAIDSRDALDEALTRLSQPWAGGPFSEPGRALLMAHADSVREALSRYDDGVARIRARDVPWVVTHGEPKPDNWLATPDGPRLVDWDTTLLAPPARDLWLVESGTGAELRRYAELTGRQVAPDELDHYRLRWSLTDVALYVEQFRSPHARTADTELARASLAATLEELAPGQ